MLIFRKFIRYYRPYRWLFYTDMLCALAVCAVDLAFPQILKQLTDGLFTQSAEVIRHALWFVGGGLLLLYALRYFCQYFITTWGHIMGAQMESDMRQDLFSHYQRLSFSYYDRNNTGEMMSRLVSDLFDISELAHHGPENLLISILKLSGAFIILAFSDLRLTAVLFAVTLIMAAFSYRKNIKMRAVFLDNRKKIAGINARVQDSLAGIRVVKSFANEELEKRKFSRSNLRFLSSKVSNYRVMGKFHAGNNFFQGLLYTAILVYGGYLVSCGSMEVTDLAIYALYVGIFIAPLEMLINFTEQFQRGYAGFKRFVEIIDTMPEIQDVPQAIALTAVKGAIEFDHVSFSYDTHNPVLHDIDLKLSPGKTIALVGPSGGGKTTICSLLPRFYDVSAGSIRVDGTDIRNVTLESLRSAIGIVQQDVYLFNGTLRQNIAYGRPEATDEEIAEAARRANIHDYIIGLENGYDTHAGERGIRLSGGQKQRIAIARVFLKNPPILVLDEATSALDNESERYIQSALEELSRGRTTIVIAHRLSTIRNADEIVVINEGRISERGSHTALLKTDGLYAKYYRMQFQDN